MRVMMAGGGIGGLTAAIALRRVGAEVVVFERARRMRAVGAGLLLAANALKALRKIGLAFVPVLALLGSGVFSVRDLLALPTAGFVATYALGAAAGVRLADGRAVRRLALAASLLVYPFLGWAALYPALAGSAGLLAWRLGRRRRSTGGTLPAPSTKVRSKTCQE